MRQDLAGALRKHHDDIVHAWTALLHELPDSRFRERPLPELRRTTSEFLRATVNALAEESYAELEDFVERASEIRFRMGFEIHEWIEGLLSFKEAAWTFVEQEFRRSPPPGSRGGGQRGRAASAGDALVSASLELDALLKWVISGSLRRYSDKLKAAACGEGSGSGAS